MQRHPTPLKVITTRAREGGSKEHRTNKQKWPRETFSYICTRALHSFRSFPHWRVASTVIPLLPKATFAPSLLAMHSFDALLIVHRGGDMCDNIALDLYLRHIYYRHYSLKKFINTSMENILPLEYIYMRVKFFLIRYCIAWTACIIKIILSYYSE